MQRFSRNAALCLVAAACVLWWTTPAYAQSTSSVDFGARVTRVSGSGGRATVTVDAGSAALLKRGMEGVFHPRRGRVVDFDVQLARGRVLRSGKSSATLEIRGVAEPIRVGAYFSYRTRVSKELADSPLFWLTALRVQIAGLKRGVTYTSVEDLLANPSQAHRNRIIDAMAADVKRMRAVIKDGMDKRIEQGRYHGMTPAQVVDSIDRKAVKDFLAFVRAFPGKYIGKEWRFAEIYMTWVISGTPAGGSVQTRRDLRALERKARLAARTGKLDEARRHWRSVLQKAPEHKTAKTTIERIAQTKLRLRRLKEDPDDTQTRYSVMDDLFDLGAYDWALKQNQELSRRKYEPFKVDVYRGYLLVRLKKWPQAIRLWKKLVKAKPKNKTYARWLRSTQAQATRARLPGNVKAMLSLAAIEVEESDWDAANSYYRKVLDSKKSSAAQRRVAAEGQRRVSLQKRLAGQMRWARENIKKHDLKAARVKIVQVEALIKLIGDPKLASRFLAELAELARQVDEDGLAIELFQKRVKAAPKDLAAHTALAFALLGAERFTEMGAVLKGSASLKGDRSYHLLLQSYLARAKGDWAQAENLAKRARQNSPKYPWPLLVQVRTRVRDGRWARASKLAEKALKLDDDWQIRSTYTAVQRGLRAYEALQAAPDSKRDRLALVRSYAALGLVDRAKREIAKLPAGPWRRDGWWAVASSNDLRIRSARKLEAARNAAPQSRARKRIAEILELREAMRKPTPATRVRLATLLNESGYYDDALASLGPLMSGKVSPRVGDLVHQARRALAATDTLQLAQESLARNDGAWAVRLARKAQQAFDGVKNAQARAAALQTQAQGLALQGKYSQAISLARKARDIVALEGDALATSVADRQLGQNLSNRGSLDELSKYTKAALPLCVAANDEECSYYAHLQLAHIATSEGRTALSVDHARKAWGFARMLGQRQLARNARFELADSNLAAGRFGDAERLAKDLLADARNAADVTNEQFSLMVLGAVAIMRGKGKAARARFQEVYTLGTRSGRNNMRAVARHFAGKAWLSADHDPKRAAKAFAHSAKLYKDIGATWALRVRGDVLRDLADAQLQAGQLANARATANEAVALATRFKRIPELASANWVLALVAIAEGKADPALQAATRALAAAKKGDNLASRWNAWYAVAKARAMKGQKAKAGAAYEEALDYLGRALLASGGSESERDAYMNTGRVRQVYRDAIQHFLKLGQSRRAMEILEISRDARLKQVFDPTQIVTSDKKLRKKLDKYAQTRARVKGLNEQLNQAMAKPSAQRSQSQVKALGRRIARTRQEMKQVVLDLKLSHRALFKALAVDPQNLVARRKDLPQGSVLIEYFVAEDALYAFIVSAGRSEPGVVRVPVTSKKLEETIADFRHAIIKEPERVSGLGRQLDDWLLEPLRPHLGGSNTLIVMPFGPLYYLPFDALVVSGPKQPVRYAIEDFRISVQTATTLEKLLEPARAAVGGTMLAVANPDGSLPGAQREVKRIVRTAVPDAKVLARKQATVGAFQSLAGSFRYLHLATHGTLDSDPRKTHLKMADGPLSVHQIAGLDGLERGNELVVLSACDTAMEKGRATGDELVSLAFAFAMAGAPALVSSLWEVDDSSTATLMASFYRALEQKGGQRLDALRNAKLSLMRTQRGSKRPFASPFYWASFQLYGDFRAPKTASK